MQIRKHWTRFEGMILSCGSTPHSENKTRHLQKRRKCLSFVLRNTTYCARIILIGGSDAGNTRRVGKRKFNCLGYCNRSVSFFSFKIFGQGRQVSCDRISYHCSLVLFISCSDRSIKTSENTEAIKPNL